MKDKVMFLIIGILIGAIITTAGFLIYNKTVAQNTNQPEMMQTNPNGQMGEPPEKPDGDSGEEPPAKPEDSNNSTNS